MHLSDLLPSLRDLPREDKLRAIQYLTEDLVKDAATTPTGECEIWSPTDAHQAAHIMTELLKKGTDRE